MRHKQLGLLVWMMLITSLVSVAQDHPQKSSKPSVSPHLTLMGFTLGKDTIADVQKELGRSTVGRCSNEQDASKEVCYASAAPPETRVYFEAGVSGGWTQLDGFRVVSGDRVSNCGLQCPATATVRRDIQTGGGLKIGLIKGEVLSLLGSPAHLAGNKLTFEWQSRRRMTKGEMQKSGQHPVTYPYWNVVDTIEVKLIDGRVAEFEVTHSVTD